MQEQAKERPILFSGPMVRALLTGAKTQTRRSLPVQPPAGAQVALVNGSAQRFGRAGDRLWVRETWAYHMHAQGSLADDDGPWVYAADGVSALQQRLSGRWRPSIFMPRYASRILLEVTEVRIERLQAISVDDALAEGITHSTMNDPRVEFQWLWASINGADSWAANPWVWAISFLRVEP